MPSFLLLYWLASDEVADEEHVVLLAVINTLVERLVRARWVLCMEGQHVLLYIPGVEEIIWFDGLLSVITNVITIAIGYFCMQVEFIQTWILAVDFVADLGVFHHVVVEVAQFESGNVILVARASLIGLALALALLGDSMQILLLLLDSFGNLFANESGKILAGSYLVVVRLATPGFVLVAARLGLSSVLAGA